MEFLKLALDFFLHLDKHLAGLLTQYGTLTYGILFLIIFVETGLIVMPLLPGDSLLFAAGALAAMPENHLNVFVIIPLLIVAALMGDNVNYFVGKFFSKQIKSRERILFFKDERDDTKDGKVGQNGENLALKDLLLGDLLSTGHSP